jgi:hypothetical protein
MDNNKKIPGKNWCNNEINNFFGGWGGETGSCHVFHAGLELMILNCNSSSIIFACQPLFLVTDSWSLPSLLGTLLNIFGFSYFLSLLTDTHMASFKSLRRCHLPTRFVLHSFSSDIFGVVHGLLSLLQRQLHKLRGVSFPHCLKTCLVLSRGSAGE